MKNTEIRSAFLWQQGILYTVYASNTSDVQVEKPRSVDQIIQVSAQKSCLYKQDAHHGSKQDGSKQDVLTGSLVITEVSTPKPNIGKNIRDL